MRNQHCVPEFHLKRKEEKTRVNKLEKEKGKNLKKHLVHVSEFFNCGYLELNTTKENKQFQT